MLGIVEPRLPFEGPVLNARLTTSGVVPPEGTSDTAPAVGPVCEGPVAGGWVVVLLAGGWVVLLAAGTGAGTDGGEPVEVKVGFVPAV